MENKNLGIKTKKRWSWKKQLFIGLLAVVVFLVVFAGTTLYTLFKGLGPEDPADVTWAGQKEPLPGERINILVLGVDDEVVMDGVRIARRADTMFVVSVDPLMNEASVISIPRDTRVDIPGRANPEKINHAHAYGGPSLAVETVEGFLGTPIHYYIRIDYKAFVAIIDEIGGIHIDVERDMRYEDPYQDLYIDIKKGPQILDGKTSLDYVRFRNDSKGDIGRIERQQKFIDALVDQMLSLGSLTRLPKLASHLAQYVDTNIDGSKILEMGKMAITISPENLHMTMIPGEPKDLVEYGFIVNYWIADQEATKEIVDRHLRGIDADLNSGIRVEVLNGSVDSISTHRMVSELEKQGFQVVHVGLSDEELEVTRVVNHSTDDNTGKIVARSVTHIFGETELYRSSDRSMKEEIDVTIILSKDQP